mmetsp:Transcript_20571/g.27107  ORF Transcript_20571/g.27107 Transcript_20571/m.27107 type:complete len:715 (+) Transcript_20571:296-2440(+)
MSRNDEMTEMSQTWNQERLPDIGENGSIPGGRRTSDSTASHKSAEGRLMIPMKGSGALRLKNRKAKPRKLSEGVSVRKRSVSLNSSRHDPRGGGISGYTTPISLNLTSPTPPESYTPINASRGSRRTSRGTANVPFSPTDLSKAFSRHSSRASQRTTLTGMDTEIDHLYAQHVAFSNKITHQGRKLQHIERQLAELEEQVEIQRVESKKPMQHFVKDQKLFKRLEARLQHVTSHLSIVEHEREKLRGKVNGLRMEKMGIRGTHDALQCDLRRKTKELDELKQDTNRLQSQQQQRISEMNDIKARAVVQVENFKEEFEARKSAVLMEVPMAGPGGSGEASAMDNSGMGPTRAKTNSPRHRQRDNADLHNFITSARGSGGRNAHHHRGKKGSIQLSSAALEELSRSGVSVMDQQTASQMQESTQHEDDVLKRKLHRTNKNIDHILASTGVSSVEEFVETMNDAETRHYNWFKIISDMNKDHEELDVERINLEKQITEAGHYEIASEERRSKLKELELKVTQIRKKTENFETTYSEESAVLDNLRENILHIFYMLGCAENPAGANLKAQGFNPENALGFLALIEQRLDTIMQVQAIQTKHTVSYSAFAHGRENSPPPGSQGVTAVTGPLPSTSSRAHSRVGGSVMGMPPPGTAVAKVLGSSIHTNLALGTLDVDEEEADHPLDLTELQELVSKEYNTTGLLRLTQTGKTSLRSSIRK